MRTPKMLREWLCESSFLYAADRDRAQDLIDLIDRIRPLGPDGKHGDRHTPYCGCGDVGPVTIPAGQLSREHIGQRVEFIGERSGHLMSGLLFAAQQSMRGTQVFLGDRETGWSSRDRLDPSTPVTVRPAGGQ